MARSSLKSQHPVSFDITTESQHGPRLGRLSFPGRDAIDTPNFIPASSRGVIPHVTPDMMRDYLSVNSVYAALEDCMSAATLLATTLSGD